MLLFASACAMGAISAGVRLPSTNCAWEAAGKEPSCTQKANTWDNRYPNCSVFQYANHTPIPCQGATKENYCKFQGEHANSSRPLPASFHVHIFFPNVNCSNCSASFRKETSEYSYAGAMTLRAEVSEKLNTFAAKVLSQLNKTLSDPIDVAKAARDPTYNHCGDAYRIVAGAPANFHAEPCIFEVDAVKEGGPFTDPLTGDGYPNYSFFIPSEYWLPGLLPMVHEWLDQNRGRYPVLIHPNTGCEVRDHIERASIQWLGGGYPLLPTVFSCDALGCNQACPRIPPAWPLPMPADCPWGGAYL
jgi:aromatic ring-cleaving dioxygenase